MLRGIRLLNSRGAGPVAVFLEISGDNPSVTVGVLSATETSLGPAVVKSASL